MKKLFKFFTKTILTLILLFGIATIKPLSAQTCSIIGDTEICENEVVSYSTNDTGNVYQWNAYNGIVSGVGSNIDVSWNSPGTGELTLVVKDGLNQVVCTHSIDVTIHASPTPTIQPSFTTSCNNDPRGEEGPDGQKDEGNPCFSVCDSTWITYSTPHNNSSTYSWSITGNAEVNPSTTNEIEVMWTGTGTGVVEVMETDSNGCVGIDEICVDILPKPIAAIDASGGVINACLNQDILFINNSSAGAGSPLWSYTWVFDDGTIETLDASSSNGNVTHSYSTPGIYNLMLIAENECHCTDTAYITVNVSANPGPDIECISTVCPGSVVTYFTNATCPAYNWSVTNGTIVGDSTSNEVTVSWGSASPAYLSLATDGCGGYCPSPTTVEIPLITPTADIHGDELVCQYECKTYTLDCNIPVDSIVWHFPDGVTVQSDTINTHEVDVCFYDPSFTGGQIEVEYFHHTPGSVNDLSCGGTATFDISVRPSLFLNYPNEICDSAILDGNYTNATSGNIEWTITDAAETTTYLTLVQGANLPFQPTWVDGPGIFKITAEDLSNNYCNAPQSFILKVNALPDPPDSIIGPDPVCSGVPLQYYAFSTSANYIMEWEFENGSPAQNVGQSASVVWDNTGPYVISVTQTNPVTGCTSAAYTDTIDPILPLTPSEITGNDTVCANGQQNYTTLSPGDDFVWSVSPQIAGSVISGQHEQDIVVEWNNYNGTATLSLERTACGESITTDYTVEVIAPPTPGITVPADACQGTSVTMTAVAAGATFTWDFGDGGTATGASVNHVFNSPGNHVVTVEASYSGFCTATATNIATIMINPKPNITISTPDPNIFCGSISPVNMYVASPVTGSSYEWYSNASPTPVSSGTSYTSSSIGFYYVIGDNSFGCIDTSNVIPIDTTCADPCTPEPGSFVDFTRTRLDCNLDSFAGTYSAGAFNPIYDFDDPYSGSNFVAGPNATHTFTEPGFYNVELCVRVPNDDNTDTCLICVTKTDTINYIPDFIDSVYCEDGSGSISVKLINNTKVLSTAPSPTYEWTVNSGGVVSTAENPTLSFVPGTYLITLIVNGVCEISKTIVIDDLPDATILANDSVCIDAPIQLSSATTGSIVSSIWDFGDGAGSLIADPVKTYSPAGLYTVSLQLTNSYGCVDESTKDIVVLPNTLSTSITALSDTVFCEGDSVELQSTVNNGYPGYSYLWSTVETSPSVWAQHTGLYYLEVTDNKACYSRSNNVGVLVNPVPKPKITGNKVVCVQNQEAFTVNYPSGPYTIEWTLNGNLISWATQSQYFFYSNSTGSFTLSVKVMSPDSCIGYDTINIEVVPNPNVTIATTGTLCEGEAHLLDGNTTSPNITQSFWNNGSVNDSLYASVPGGYTYTVVDSFGCEASATTTIQPLPDFCGLMTGCYDICDTISSLVWHAPKGYASYQWLYNETAMPGSTYDTLHIPLYQSGEYQVVISTASGCTDTSDIIDINFIECISCDITVTDTIFCGPVDENGNQTYTVEFEIDNNFGPGAFVNIYSLQGDVTGIVPSVIPLGTSTVTATFTDLAPIDTEVCFSVTLTYNNERCDIRVCSKLPDCSTHCVFGVYSSCAHCKKETADGWQYSIELTVQNNFGSNGTLSVLPVSGGSFGTISPNPVPPGLTTVEIPFTDVNPSDSIICFRILMEVNGRFCAQDVCVYLPECRFTGITSGFSASNFRVMPNPASDQLSVKGDFEQDATLTIINTSGKVFRTALVDKNETLLDITDLKPGIYLIKVQQSTGTLQQTFIKK